MAERLEVTALTPPVNLLGESPVWCVRSQSLYWVDVRGRTVHRSDVAGKEIRSWTMPQLVGCVALRASGGLILALASGIATLDPDTGIVKMVASADWDRPNMRFNDGRCDRQGRLWVGSMDDVGRGPVGHLYRLDGNRLTAVLDGVAVPNSLCWSPDGRTMYFADGVEPVIWAYDFDVAKGVPANRRLFVRLPEGSGIPDGANVDADGFLWSAHYGGGAVNRYAPDGRIDRVIRLPVSRPTSCTFGGPELDMLFITSARQRLSEAELDAQPLAGAVLAISTGARGLPEPEVSA